MAGTEAANSASRVDEAKQVMDKVFGPYTGPGWRPEPYTEGKGRYLWTDSFGIMNYLSLFHSTQEQAFLAQAEALIQDVHDTLGRGREGIARLGAATEERPTRGGLRIGKADPEGTQDGDGQYFHYLTKHALALTAAALTKQDTQLLDWAVDLIKAIHPAFVVGCGAAVPRMVWKTSIDLSRPAVQSMGNLDPYDGFVTYCLVEQANERLRGPGAKVALPDETADMRRMVEERYSDYRSTDPLDLGEALWLSHWFPSEAWAQVLAERSIKLLDQLWQLGYFRMPAECWV